MTTTTPAPTTSDILAVHPPSAITHLALQRLTAAADIPFGDPEIMPFVKQDWETEAEARLFAALDDLGDDPRDLNWLAQLRVAAEMGRIAPLVFPNTI